MIKLTLSKEDSVELLDSVPQSPGVYRIQNTITGRIYIGQAEDLHRRVIAHRSDVRCGRHGNRHLLASMRKYGLTAFTFEVLRQCDVEYLDMYENRFIASYPWDQLYNQNKRASGRKLVATSTRKGVPNPRSPETCEKLRLAGLGRVQSQQCREKVRAAQLGHKRSPESIAKLKATLATKRAAKQQASTAAVDPRP